VTIEQENFKRAKSLGKKLGIFIDIRKEPQSIILDILEKVVEKLPVPEAKPLRSGKMK